MTSVDDLRAAQAALRERYSAEPSAAVIGTTAVGTICEDEIAVTVDTASEPIRVGLHAAVGGVGTDACAADMLAQALVACIGTTFGSVATAMRLRYADAEVRATGSWDARGTLGPARDVEVGLAPIEVTITLDTDASERTLARAAELTAKHCVVGESLKHPPRVSVVRRTA